jgi:hypothetical protein
MLQGIFDFIALMFYPPLNPQGGDFGSGVDVFILK